MKRSLSLHGQIFLVTASASFVGVAFVIWVMNLIAQFSVVDYEVGAPALVVIV